MKIRKCIVLVILMVICAGCGTQQPAGETVSPGETVSRTAVEKPAIREMKTIKENGHYMISEYDPDGNLLTEVYYDADSNETGRTDYTYIENGNMSLKVSSGSERGSYQKIVYDADGNKTEEYDGDSEADAVLNNKYEYADGKLIREIFYAHKETPFWIREYEYDEKGLLIRKEQKSEDGYIYRSWDYTYDDAGNLIHSKNTRGYEYTAEYNEYGYPIRVHDVCTDTMRNAGTYDISEKYEYVYY